MFLTSVVDDNNRQQYTIHIFYLKSNTQAYVGPISRNTSA